MPSFCSSLPWNGPSGDLAIKLLDSIFYRKRSIRDIYLRLLTVKPFFIKELVPPCSVDFCLPLLFCFIPPEKTDLQSGLGHSLNENNFLENFYRLLDLPGEFQEDSNGKNNGVERHE